MKKQNVFALAFLIMSTSGDQDDHANHEVTNHCIDTPIEVISSMVRESYGLNKVSKASHEKKLLEKLEAAAESLSLSALEAYDVASQAYDAADILTKIDIETPDQTTMDWLDVIASIIEDVDPRDHLGLHCS